MAAMNFRDEHALKGAFVSNKLLRLVDLIADQGDDLLREADITVPARAVACTLFIGDKGQVSLADIAKALDEPHQLSAQRVEGLIELGLLERRDDPKDRRRKVLRLTKSGKAQYQRLLVRLAEIEQALTELYAEIDHDLPAILDRAIDALRRTPLLERIRKHAATAGASSKKQKAK
ncbi:MAG: winged helix DNA-binding protein [Hyphomonas sp.]|uniref:winged helix DNA-binding protein n=1 Tax=Hyphomonas sp. TaxID=87 RepID=UPI0035291523